MRSPTQRDLTPSDIGEVVAAGLGAEVVAAAELTGGGFAAVWGATLADGREVVVKVGPPPSARLLAYEKGAVPAEAEYYDLIHEHVPGVPVPEVLAVAPEWTITTRLPGRLLTEGDAPRARADLGAAVARIHTVTGSRFGFTGDRPSGGDWPTAFGAIIESLRADARLWQVPLPPLDGVVKRHHDVLATVTRPALL
ncbi:MAG TPA: phosphotransferase, partial [Actinoplanes sp.]